ncbi:MAG TPA: alpha/beta family hydrolase [Dehalococcoidia bacterium]|nr:alpha/beta family hydrolase [Dehalococcoidia bacterium]
MPSREFSVDVPGAGGVTCIRTTPSRGGARWIVVYAPGAGANLHDPFGAHLAATLPSEGIAVVRMQFPYMQAGKKSPDRQPVLEATWRAVLERVADGSSRVVVSGRSMGGRIGSMVVADGAPADALALFAYPLHPPGKPEQQRVEHLPKLKLPTLFVSGTNDAFGSPEELQAAAKRVRGAKLHLLDGADHGFSVKKSSGRTREDVWAEASSALLAWIGVIE